MLIGIDCTEQQIPLHENRIRKKMYYSGKKKKHTVKNQYMVSNDEIIIHKIGHKQEE